MYDPVSLSDVAKRLEAFRQRLRNYNAHDVLRLAGDPLERDSSELRDLRGTWGELKLELAALGVPSAYEAPAFHQALRDTLQPVAQHTLMEISKAKHLAIPMLDEAIGAVRGKAERIKQSLDARAAPPASGFVFAEGVEIPTPVYRAREVIGYIEEQFSKENFPQGVPDPSLVTHYWTPAQAGKVSHILDGLDAITAVLDRLPAAERDSLGEARGFLETVRAQWQRGPWRSGTEPTLQARHVAAVYKAVTVALNTPAIEMPARPHTSIVVTEPAPLRSSPLPQESSDTFLARLELRVPGAANSYRQAVLDLKAERLSYRGPANELRQALWEVLQTLAPDSAVIAEPEYKQEAGTKGPTHRQRAAFIMRQRLGEKPSESVLTAIDTIAALAREIYMRSSGSTHRQESRDEALQLQRYVEVVLRDLVR